jgi:hypothetical protein
VQESEEEKGGELRDRELLEKRRGTNASLYLAEGSGWQMKAAQTPYRTRRAVRAVTGPLDQMA